MGARKAVVPGADLDGVFAAFGDYCLEKLGLDPRKNISYYFRDSYGPKVEQAVELLIGDIRSYMVMQPNGEPLTYDDGRYPEVPRVTLAQYAAQLKSDRDGDGNGNAVRDEG